MHRLARTQHTYTCTRVYYLKTQIPVEAEPPPNLKQQVTQLIMLSHKTNNRTNNRIFSFSQEFGGGGGRVGVGRVGEHGAGVRVGVTVGVRWVGWGWGGG